MKKHFFYFFLFLLTYLGNSQSKILKNIEGTKLVNSGVMMNSDNSVNGYYFFYEVDKVSKRERKFSIKILDQNLNEVLNKSFIEDKSSSLSQVKYNNQKLMFRIYNREDFKYIFYSLDSSGNLNKDFEYEEGIKNYVYRNDHTTQLNGSTVSFHPINDKGFLFYVKTKNKKFGYRLEYFATNGGENWSYISNKDLHEISTILNVEDSGIIIQEIEKKKLLARDYKACIKVLKPETGEIVFKKEFLKGENEKHLSNNAFIYENNLVIIGEYWEDNDKAYRDQSKGMFIDKYAFTGDRVFSKEVSWADNFEKTFNDLNDEKGKNYLFFHDFIKTNNGHIYAIGEQYRKTLSASSLGATQLTITDTYILHFDQEFSLIDITKFDKGKSRVSDKKVGGSAQIQALLLSRLGGFDYAYTQIDKDNDRFYSLFLDYERLKGEKNKMAFKAIIYNNGKLTEDKIYLEDGAIETKAKAAKTGYVLLINQDKKKKEVKLHLEKLNIE